MSDADLISMNEIARRLRCSPGAAAAWVRKGQLEAVREGRRYLVTVAEFNAFRRRRRDRRNAHKSPPRVGTVRKLPNLSERPIDPSMLIIQGLCQTTAEFSLGTVVAALAQAGIERRVMGSLMKAAISQGWCTRIGEKRVEPGVQSHGRPVPIYRSNLFQQQNQLLPVVLSV